MARIRYSGSDPVWVEETALHNPGLTPVLANGMEREVPDKVAKELAERPYFSIVEDEPAADEPKKGGKR